MKVLVYRVPLKDTINAGEFTEYDVNLGLPEVTAAFSDYIEKMKYQAKLEEIKVSFTDTHMVCWVEFIPSVMDYNESRPSEVH